MGIHSKPHKHKRETDTNCSWRAGKIGHQRNIAPTFHSVATADATRNSARSIVQRFCGLSIRHKNAAPARKALTACVICSRIHKRPVKSRISSTTTSKPTMPLGPQPQPWLYGYTGSPPTKASSRMMRRIVPTPMVSTFFTGCAKRRLTIRKVRSRVSLSADGETR